MSKHESQYKRVTEIANQLAKKQLPLYRHKKSPHRFTWPHLQEVPDHSTLCRAFHHLGMNLLRVMQRLLLGQRLLCSYNKPAIYYRYLRQLWSYQDSVLFNHLRRQVGAYICRKWFLLADAGFDRRQTRNGDTIPPVAMFVTEHQLPLKVIQGARSLSISEVTQLR